MQAMLSDVLRCVFLTSHVLDQVIGKVVEVEDMVQSDGTRKRMKHLAHLPISGMHLYCYTQWYHFFHNDY